MELYPKKTHLKGAFVLSGILDLAFLFIEEIWHDVQKGSGYILSSTSSQILSVSTRSLLAGDTDNIWEDVELRIDPDPFCTSCQISSMNKKARAKIPLKSEASFKWVFMDIILSTATKRLTSDTTFSNYLLIFDAYSKIPKLYGMEKITTEEVMDKLDIF